MKKYGASREKMYMIYSKFIKIICYIVMGIVCLAALVLLFAGVDSIFEEDLSIGRGIGLIVVSLIIPLIALISLYPIFALANIDENLQSLKNKVDSIIGDTNSFETNECNKDFNKSKEFEENPINRYYENKIDNKQDIEMHDNNDILDVSVLAIEYFNDKFNLDLDSEDDYQTTAEKIYSIEDNSPSIQTLKLQISEANTRKEVYKILNKYRVAYS